jgi:hypothetical protein
MRHDLCPPPAPIGIAYRGPIRNAFPKWLDAPLSSSVDPNRLLLWAICCSGSLSPCFNVDRLKASLSLSSIRVTLTNWLVHAQLKFTCRHYAKEIAISGFGFRLYIQTQRPMTAALAQ